MENEDKNKVENKDDKSYGLKYPHKYFSCLMSVTRVYTIQFDKDGKIK